MDCTYIPFFETSICPVRWIDVLTYCGLRHGIEGYVADALLDFLSRAFVLEYCSKFDKFLLETNTCSVRGTSSGRKYPFYPLISYVFPFPEHLHWFLPVEARQVPVWPLLENHQRAVWGMSARRNGATKWRQTLQTCGGEVEEHTHIFGPNLRLYASYALCLQPPEWRGTLTIYHTSRIARQNLGITTEGGHTLTSMKRTCSVFCRLRAWDRPPQWHVQWQLQWQKLWIRNYNYNNNT